MELEASKSKEKRRAGKKREEPKDVMRKEIDGGKKERWDTEIPLFVVGRRSAIRISHKNCHMRAMSWVRRTL